MMMYTNVPGRLPIELPANYAEFAWYYPDCELETKAWVVTHAQPDWVYLDCGANIGYYSILFAQLSPSGTVHAIEPTSTADLLATNLAYHKIKNVSIHRVALSDQAGRRTEDVYRLWGHAADRKEYDFSTIDSLVAEQGVNRLDCIKIDVDSYDFEVLRGAEQTLARFDPWVVIELSEGLSLRNTTRNEVLSWLSARNYTTAIILDRENFLLKRNTGSEQGQIPLTVLQWATNQGFVHMLKREVGRTGGPVWTRPDYAAAAFAESAKDHSWVDRFQRVFSSGAATPCWQLFQYASIAKHFVPDLIIELGGWNGDTTRALAVGLAREHVPHSHLASFHTSVVSHALDSSPQWGILYGLHGIPRIEFHAAIPKNAELEGLMEGKNRVMVFANDPSSESCDQLLGSILPLLAKKEHLVVVSGISDSDFSETSSYLERPGIYALHTTQSSRADLAALLDFTSRNQIRLFSADRSLHSVIGSQPKLKAELESALDQLFALQAHWRWFSLNEQQIRTPIFPSYS